MKLIDRYIIRQFLINFVILSVVMLLLIVLIDLLFSIDEFVEAAKAREEKEGGDRTLWTLFVIGDYYGPMALFIYVYLSGMLVVGAMGFTVAAMARSRELVTMISSGISLQRVAAPILVVGCLLNGMTLINQELIIPKLKSKLARKRHKLKEESSDTFAVFFAHEKEKTVLLSAAKFIPEDEQLNGVSILIRDEKGRHRKRITADKAHWDERRQRWHLIGGKVFEKGEQSGDVNYVFQSPSKPIEYFDSDLSPRLLMTRRAEIYSSLLGMGELGELLASEASNKSNLLRVMHSRFSLIVMNVLILVMTLPVFLTREPTNTMLQALKAALLAVGAWIGGVSFLVISSDTFNPVVLAWLPVVVYLPVSTWLMHRIRT